MNQNTLLGDVPTDVANGRTRVIIELPLLHARQTAPHRGQASRQAGSLLECIGVKYINHTNPDLVPAHGRTLLVEIRFDL